MRPGRAGPEPVFEGPGRRLIGEAEGRPGRNGDPGEGVAAPEAEAAAETAPSGPARPG